MLAFFPELLDIEEPLLKEDWTQCNENIFQLPYEGVTRHTHPKVPPHTFHSDSRSSYNQFCSFNIQEYKYAVEKLRASYYLNTSSAEAIKSANIALMSDLTFNDSILKAVVLQTGVNTNSSNAKKNKNTFLFRYDENLGKKNAIASANI